MCIQFLIWNLSVIKLQERLLERVGYPAETPIWIFSNDSKSFAQAYAVESLIPESKLDNSLNFEYIEIF